MSQIQNCIRNIDLDDIAKLTHRHTPEDNSQSVDALRMAQELIGLAHGLIRWATNTTSQQDRAELYILPQLADLHGEIDGANDHTVSVADVQNALELEDRGDDECSDPDDDDRWGDD